MQSIQLQPLAIDPKPQWLVELAQAFNDPMKLLAFLELNPADFKQDILARQLFPLRVPKAFAEKMEKGNPNDPLFLQVMSAKEEFDQVEGFTQDPLEEQHSPAPNILHKYHNRLLFMIKNSCAVNCRYCFRRHFPYQEVKSNKAIWQESLAYIEQHTELEEVIFSGGDPLMAKDEELDWLLTHLEKIEHLKTLRIHSRLHVTIPSRITSALCQRLAHSRLNIVLVSHINHANEIDDLLAEKFAELKKAGVTLLNQSVLLKGINDNAQTLKMLSDKLFSVGVLPYYLHLLDKVEGASHFWIEDERAFDIYRELQKITSGYLVPKLTRELAREPNKTLMG
nr:EF-P beta-lysylation protein EpmB [uncultured Haemophilus sp.]